MRLLVGCTVLFASTLGQAAHVAVDRERTQQELQTLSQQVAIAEQQIEQAPASRAQLQAAVQQLQAAQAQINELLRQIAAAPPAQSVAQQYPPPPPPPTYLSPMGEATLRSLIQSINGVPFSSDKVNVLHDAAAGNFFLVEQVARIIPLYAHSSDKIAALQILAPLILDRGNNFKLIPLFNFAGDRDQARKILESAPPPPTAR